MTIVEKVKTVKVLSDLQQEVVDMRNEIRHEMYRNNRAEFVPVFDHLEGISREIAFYGCTMLFGRKLGQKVYLAVQKR